MKVKEHALHHYKAHLNYISHASWSIHIGEPHARTAEVDVFCYNSLMINEQLLEATAKALVAPGRGILAADESTASANKRFALVGVEETEENRRLYRQLLLMTPEAKQAISGVIFYDETFWQKTDDGRTMSAFCADNGILPGIKVDEGDRKSVV